MAKLLRGRKRRLVLDIGASAIRLCELSQTKAGYQLTKFYRQPYNSDPGLDDADKKAARKEACIELLKTAKVRTRKTVFGVPGQSVFTRTRALPPVPEFKVAQIVKYEIQQQIPFSLDQIAMDYQILSRTEAGGYDVMMAAIKTDVVDKHIDVIEAAKRSVDIVDVCPLAAYNWLKHSGEFGDGNECVALIDIGAATTDIVIEREGQFRFTRPLNIGGNDFTLALASAFGLNFKDAEKIKTERGFAPTGDAKVDGKGGEVIGGVLQRLSSEIQRSFSYFRSLPGGGQVNRVVLCGGGACLRNLVPYMQRVLGMEVRIAQPLAGLAVGPNAQAVSEMPEQACVALGLSLRCLDNATLELNLIPPRVLEAARRKEQAFYWALSLTTLALIMASVIPVKANENKEVLERIELLKRMISMYDQEVMVTWRPGQPVPPSRYQQELQQTRQQINRLQRDVETLDSVWQSGSYWLEEIALINASRPATGGIWFSSMETAIICREGGGQGAQQPGRAQPGQGLSGLAQIAGTTGGGGGRRSMRGGSDFNVTSFPGIEPQLGAGAGAANSGRTGGGLGALARGGRGAGGQQQSGPINHSIPTPDGLTVYGFAETDAVIKEFVETLRSARQPIAGTGRQLVVNEVKFSEASVQKYPIQVLQDAPPMGGFNMQNAGYNPTGQDAVFSFVVHLCMDELDANQLQQQDAQQAGGADTVAMGGGGQGGF